MDDDEATTSSSEKATTPPAAASDASFERQYNEKALWARTTKNTCRLKY